MGSREGESNLSKHGITLAKATIVFGDPLSIPIRDLDHPWKEQRFLDIGLSSAGPLLVGAYTERGNRIRIIGAREATREDRNQYEADVP